MHRTTIGLIVLAALLFCCLIAGTPVNNDPSPHAERAGIHLTTTPHAARSVVSAAVASIGLRLTIVTLAMGALVSTVRRRPVLRAEKPPRELLRSRSGERRGPPAFVI